VESGYPSDYLTGGENETREAYWELMRSKKYRDPVKVMLSERVL